MASSPGRRWATIGLPAAVLVSPMLDAAVLGKELLGYHLTSVLPNTLNVRLV